MNKWDFRCIECHKRLQIAEHGICSRCLKKIRYNALLRLLRFVVSR